MPWTRPRSFFLDLAGSPFTHYSRRLEEPASGTSTDDEVPLTYTPLSAGETLRAGAAGGPAGRAGVEVSTDAGATWHDPTSAPLTLGTAGVVENVTVRPFSASYGTDDSEVSTIVAVVTRGRAPSWLG